MSTKSNVSPVVSPVAHLPTLKSENLSPANQFNATRAAAVAAARRTAPAETALNLDPRKVSIIQDTIAYVVDSKRITDKSSENIAYKVAVALNKAGVPAERKGEHVWTRAAALAEMARLDAAGKL